MSVEWVSEGVGNLFESEVKGREGKSSMCFEVGGFISNSFVSLPACLLDRNSARCSRSSEHLFNS